MVTDFRVLLFFIIASTVIAGCANNDSRQEIMNEFPASLTKFVAYDNNPVFSGTDSNTWDKHIRERGYILKEDSTDYLWYTGYINENDEKHLGLAISNDGIKWQRFADTPIYSGNWVEDMCIIKVDTTYYMFAEGRGDTAHLLTSNDRIHWEDQGNIDIRQTNGSPITAGSFGTPSIYKEGNTWYLFYERGDLGIWLASSVDLKTWKNVQDEPVISLGPDHYDLFAVAMNQVIKYNGRYYGYYHASADKEWKEWSTNIAVSSDLIHWKKYPGNPILKENKSSGILVDDGKRYLLYSMHDKVSVHYPIADIKSK